MKRGTGFFLLLVFCLQLHAARWTGAAGNGAWNDASNWEGGVVPGGGDEVLLNNDLLPGNYQVVLPDDPVTVFRLLIYPSPGSVIALLLPVTNTISSAAGSTAPRAMSLLAPGYAIELGDGALFVNASGSSSGYALRFIDSLRINNGGRFIHRSRTGHAEMVDRLSRDAGTENGVFRLENTDAASVISLSGRVFGRLELSAAFAPGQQLTYTAAGTMNGRVRSDLVLEPGVKLVFNFSQRLEVDGQLLGSEATLNLASAARSLQLVIKGNLHWQGGGIEAVNSTGAIGEVLLAGDRLQHLLVTGILAVKTTVQNSAGVVSDDDLSISRDLQLTGSRLQFPAGKKLVLQAAARLLSDSLDQNAYVDGLIRQLGWQGQPIRFPVGVRGQRWIQLSGGSGNLDVQYLQQSPGHVSAALGNGIDHISQTEYWQLGFSFAQVVQAALSFDPVYSGSVSDLASLRVAYTDPLIWQDGGNQATTGNTTYGSVTSAPVFLGPAACFSLAGSITGENILPLHFIRQSILRNAESWSVMVHLGEVEDSDVCELEYSSDGRLFQGKNRQLLTAGQKMYQWPLRGWPDKGFCRPVLIGANGKRIPGKAMRYSDIRALTRWSLVAVEGGDWLISSELAGNVRWQWFDVSGKLLQQGKMNLQRGNNTWRSPSHQRPGIYVLTICDGRQPPQSFRVWQR